MEWLRPRPDNAKQQRFLGQRAARRSSAVQGSQGIVFFSAFAFRNFFAIHADIDGRLDADSNLSTIDRHDGHFHIVTDP
jgi:hypothetical protein